MPKVHFPIAMKYNYLHMVQLVFVVHTQGSFSYCNEIKLSAHDSVVVFWYMLKVDLPIAMQ